MKQMPKQRKGRRLCVQINGFKVCVCVAREEVTMLEGELKQNKMLKNSRNSF